MHGQEYKAELSNLSAQTKLMPLWYKAELSNLSAQTKLMPLKGVLERVPLRCKKSNLIEMDKKRDAVKKDSIPFC
jgi:hypothetical protein